MKEVQILVFEIGQTCNMDMIHDKCPINDPERYKFGDTSKVLSDATIIEFWLWAYGLGFRGAVFWHLYNEPTLELQRINNLVDKMRAIHPDVKTHLWTNGSRGVTNEALNSLVTTERLKLVGFNHIQHTNYHIVGPDDLDNRRESAHGDGVWGEVPPSGHCTRGYGWELIIDNHGNWLKCCSDFRCENNIGNIHVANWNDLLNEYKVKATIDWVDRESFEGLTRMCRSCIQNNPNLHKSATLVGYGG